MPKNKLKKFTENATFPNFLQPDFDDIKNGFHLKGKWGNDFFGNSGPVIIELGCGKGEYTVGLARIYPQSNFIGVDRKGARMWRGGKTSMEEGLENVGFIRTRIEFISDFFGKNEVSEIWITFPDPMPRKKQINNRLTSPSYLERYSKFLQTDGVIHLKTDNTMFYEYTLKIIEENKHKLILKTNDLYNSVNELEAAKFQTFYEEMFLKQGIRIKYLQFTLK